MFDIESKAIGLEVGMDISQDARYSRAAEQGFDISKIWYHGTRHDFDRFDENYLGRSVDNPTTALGFFFTDRIEGAEYWTTRRSRDAKRDGQLIIPVFLRAKNSQLISAEYFQYLLQRAQNRTIIKLRKNAEDAGFDSLKICRENGEEWIAVFNANQIRSIFSVFDPRFASSDVISEGLTDLKPKDRKSVSLRMR